MTQILVGSLIFTGLIMALSLIVLAARAMLMPRGLAHVSVNGERVLDAELGQKLLDALAHGGVRLPTSCGGAGTCGLCKVTVANAAQALPIERATLSENEVAGGVRLACQLVVRNDLELSIDSESLVARSWTCTVSGARGVAPLIREIVLALPEGASMPFSAGAYVLVTAPAFSMSFADLRVEPRHEDAWTRMRLRKLAVASEAAATRAYSLANYPGETDALMLNVRLALPPRNEPAAPPGIVSSYLFSLDVGDSLEVSGPYGDFFIKDTQREIVLIGGGVGLAPLRSHVFDQLENRKTSRRISLWYGARSRIDLYYAEDMERLASAHENFSWHVALSDPAPDDAWEGETGFIHELVARKHLDSHPDPAGCEYYLCGPPLMVEAVRAMLARLGVPRENVVYDDFGA